MEKRIVQLRTHQKNISRYENMLKTELTDLERQFVQKRLSEERFTIALLQYLPRGSIFARAHWSRTGPLHFCRARQRHGRCPRDARWRRARCPDRSYRNGCYCRGLTTRLTGSP